MHTYLPALKLIQNGGHHVTKILLFTVHFFFYLHYNIYDHDLDAKLTRSYLTALFKYNVMQMRKVSCEKGY